MVTGYSSYRIEVKNVKFIADDGRTCPRTAIVTFHNEEGEEVGSELFGAVDINLIYNTIKEGNDLIIKGEGSRRTGNPFIYIHTYTYTYIRNSGPKR